MYLLPLLRRPSKRPAGGPSADADENSFCARSAFVCRHVVTIGTLLIRSAAPCGAGTAQAVIFELSSDVNSNLSSPIAAQTVEDANLNMLLHAGHLVQPVCEVMVAGPAATGWLSLSESGWGQLLQLRGNGTT